MIKHVDELVRQAKMAQQNAYVPYSHFKVGAAIMMDDNTYVVGANVENASFGLTNCAERTALFSAIAKGYRKENMLAMAIVSNFTGSDTFPCGACRQVMIELMKPDTPVYCVNSRNEVKEYTVADFLPYAFTSEDIK